MLMETIQRQKLIFGILTCLFAVFFVPYLFFSCRKHMIGGGAAGMMGGGDEKPPSSMPTLVYLLPVVGFIGVGFAILAYCAFGT